MRVVRTAMKSMGMRDPDRGPSDYDEREDERRVLYRLLRESLNKQGNGHGSVSNNGKGWVTNTLIAIVLALSAWNLKETIANTTAIAVIQCQLNPQNCPQVAPQVNRGRSP